MLVYIYTTIDTAVLSTLQCNLVSKNICFGNYWTCVYIRSSSLSSAVVAELQTIILNLHMWRVYFTYYYIT